MTYSNSYLSNKYSQNHDASEKTKKRIYVSNKNSRKPNYKSRRYILALSLITIFTITAYSQSISDVFTIYFSTASPEIKQLGLDAGLSDHGRALFLSNNPEFVNADTLDSFCPHEKETIGYGCYLQASNKIYILQINSDLLDDIEITAVAHETLHAAWNNIATEEKQTIVDELNNLYKSNISSILSEDAKVYLNESNDVFINELNALAGSEVNISIMSSVLQNYFSKYFTNQSKAVQANLSFNQNIDNQILNINNQNTALDIQNAKLDEFKIAHLDSIEHAMNNNLRYGDIYTYNRNVDAYNHNRDIYNDMVNRYNTDIDSYNTTRQTFTRIYSELFPGREVPVANAK